MPATHASDRIVLRYIGGGDWIRGIPARDLTVADLGVLPVRRAALLESGLYTEAASASAARRTVSRRRKEP